MPRTGDVVSAVGVVSDCVIDGGLPPLIAPGVYTVCAITWSTFRVFGRANKVALKLRIIDGPHFDTEIYRYYNVLELLGKPGRHGRFRAASKCDLVREYSAIVGRPSRRDRLAMTRLENQILEAQVYTVTSSRDQSPLHASTHYSIAKKLRLA